MFQIIKKSTLKNLREEIDFLRESRTDCFGQIQRLQGMLPLDLSIGEHCAKCKHSLAIEQTGTVVDSMTGYRQTIEKPSKFICLKNAPCRQMEVK